MTTEELKSQPALVTGAAGFIGFHLSKRLLDDGWTVVGLDNLNDYYDPQLKRDRLAQLEGRDGFTFVKLDLADRAGMEKLFAENAFGVVVNLAAQAGVRYSLTNPHSYIDTNLVGFLHVLEGCRHHGVKHLVFASSSSVYGANTSFPFSESDNVDHPVSLYAASKKANELMAHTYAHLYGLPCTGLRFFTVYGPWGRPDMALFKFTKAILAGEPIDVYGHGDMRRDFTYIDDIVEGVVRVMTTLPEPDPDLDRRPPQPRDQLRSLADLQHRQQQPGGADALHRGDRAGPRAHSREEHAPDATRRRPSHSRRRRRPGRRRGLPPQHPDRRGNPALHHLVPRVLRGAWR